MLQIFVWPTLKGKMNLEGAPGFSLKYDPAPNKLRLALGPKKNSTWPGPAELIFFSVGNPVFPRFCAR